MSKSIIRNFKGCEAEVQRVGKPYHTNQLILAIHVAIIISMATTILLWLSCLPIRSKASCPVETDGFLTSVPLSVHGKDSSFHVISQHFQLSFIWTITSCPTCLWVYVFVCDWKIFRENRGRLILPYGLRISWSKECQSIAPTIFPLDLCEKKCVKA